MEEYDCMSGEDCSCLSDSDSSDVIEKDDSDFPSVPRKGPSAKVLSKKSVLAAQREDLQKVMELLSLREHQARSLLVHYRWDAEKLLDVFVEKEEVILFAKAGLTVNEDASSSPPFSSAVNCNTCMEEVSGDNVTKMDCGHSFCNDCWTEHFIVEIKEGRSRRIECMAQECNAICDEAVVRNLVSKKDPDLAQKFDLFLLESYIEDRRKIKWCPSTPHCGNAILVEEDEFCDVKCACGLEFCFSCLSEPHLPFPCWMLQLWTQEFEPVTKKCPDESETVNWITFHTKPCPNCYIRVEKDGGNNLVICICGQEFCWLCGGATDQGYTWSGIARHSCDSCNIAERAEQDCSEDMHYYNRFKAHTDSLKLEIELKETISEKALESRLGYFSWVNNGLRSLFRTRRFLSCSYAYAYYDFGEKHFNDEERERKQRLFEIQQQLFEIQQQQLETYVEELSELLMELSELLKEPFEWYSNDKVVKIRMQVIKLSSIIDNLYEKMYIFIENDLGLHSSW